MHQWSNCMPRYMYRPIKHVKNRNHTTVGHRNNFNSYITVEYGKMIILNATNIYLMNKSYAFYENIGKSKCGHKMIETLIMSEMKGSMYL